MSEDVAIQGEPARPGSPAHTRSERSCWRFAGEYCRAWRPNWLFESSRADLIANRAQRLDREIHKWRQAVRQRDWEQAKHLQHSLFGVLFDTGAYEQLQHCFRERTKQLPTPPSQDLVYRELLCLTKTYGPPAFEWRPTDVYSRDLKGFARVRFPLPYLALEEATIGPLEMIFYASGYLRIEGKHPHVSLEGKQCAGDQINDVLENTLHEGRLADAGDLAWHALQQYDGDHAYWRIDEVHSCECGRPAADDTTCARCGSYLCDECEQTCIVCDRITCRDCTPGCQRCGEPLCKPCREHTCACGVGYCAECTEGGGTCGCCGAPLNAEPASEPTSEPTSKSVSESATPARVVGSNL